MNKEKIKDLISSNSVIADAYKAFRDKYPTRIIIDMYAMTHYTVNVDEAYIKYIDYNGKMETFMYYKEY